MFDSNCFMNSPMNSILLVDHSKTKDLAQAGSCGVTPTEPRIDWTGELQEALAAAEERPPRR